MNTGFDCGVIGNGRVAALVDRNARAGWRQPRKNAVGRAAITLDMAVSRTRALGNAP